MISKRGEVLTITIIVLIALLVSGGIFYFASEKGKVQLEEEKGTCSDVTPLPEPSESDVNGLGNGCTQTNDPITPNCALFNDKKGDCEAEVVDYEYECDSVNGVQNSPEVQMGPDGTCAQANPLEEFRKLRPEPKYSSHGCQSASCTGDYSTCTDEKVLCSANYGIYGTDIQEDEMTACAWAPASVSQVSGTVSNPPVSNPPVSSSSSNLCGNGQIDAGEACDGNDFGGETCNSISNGATPNGDLVCDGGCQFDLNGCWADASWTQSSSSASKTKKPITVGGVCDWNPADVGSSSTPPEEDDEEEGGCGNGILDLVDEECDGNIFGIEENSPGEICKKLGPGFTFDGKCDGNCKVGCAQFKNPDDGTGGTTDQGGTGGTTGGDNSGGGNAGTGGGNDDGGVTFASSSGYCGDGVLDTDGPDNIADNEDDEKCETVNGNSDCFGNPAGSICGEGCQCQPEGDKRCDAVVEINCPPEDNYAECDIIEDNFFPDDAPAEIVPLPDVPAEQKEKSISDCEKEKETKSIEEESTLDGFADEAKKSPSLTPEDKSKIEEAKKKVEDARKNKLEELKRKLEELEKERKKMLDDFENSKKDSNKDWLTWGGWLGEKDGRRDKFLGLARRIDDILGEIKRLSGMEKKLDDILKEIEKFKENHTDYWNERTDGSGYDGDFGPDSDRRHNYGDAQDEYLGLIREKERIEGMIRDGNWDALQMSPQLSPEDEGAGVNDAVEDAGSFEEAVNDYREAIGGAYKKIYDEGGLNERDLADGIMKLMDAIDRDYNAGGPCLNVINSDASASLEYNLGDGLGLNGEDMSSAYSQYLDAAECAVEDACLVSVQASPDVQFAPLENQGEGKCANNENNPMIQWNDAGYKEKGLKCGPETHSMSEYMYALSHPDLNNPSLIPPCLPDLSKEEIGRIEQSRNDGSCKSDCTPQMWAFQMKQELISTAEKCCAPEKTGIEYQKKESKCSEERMGLCKRMEGAFPDACKC